MKKNYNKNNSIKSPNLILILVFIVVITMFLTIKIKAESKYNWEQLIEITQSKLEKNEESIILNYTLAVAYANTGKIKEAYNIIDIFGSSVSRKEFNNTISPYLADWELYDNYDDLLLLNYAAFREVINKNYKEAVSLFEYIYKLDANNLWALNHAAAALVEIKEYDKSMEYVEKALKMKDNEYSHLIKGYVYYEKGNYIKAVIQAAQAKDLFKSLADEEYQDFTD